MIKLLLKVAIAAFIANALIRLGAEYIVHVQFRDSVRQEMARGGTDEELAQSVLDVAAAYDVPLEPEDFTVRHETRTAVVEGSYVKPILLLPGMSYPWRFEWEIDSYDPDAEPEPSAR